MAVSKSAVDKVVKRARRGVARAKKATEAGNVVQMPERNDDNQRPERPELGKDREPIETVYSKAHAVSEVMNALLEKDMPHMHLARQAKIACVFTSADHVNGFEESVRVIRFAKVYQPLVSKPFDWLLIVSGPRWDRMAGDEAWKRAVIYYALLEIDMDENGRWRKAKPELTGFIQHLEQFGPMSEGMKRVQQLGLLK